jgi:hypothetical protein
MHTAEPVILAPFFTSTPDSLTPAFGTSFFFPPSNLFSTSYLPAPLQFLAAFTIMESSGLKLDLSQPLATLLKKATKKAHERAETSPGAKLLLSGQLPKPQYTQFLMMLWHVYQ